jgi:hypothetical protein
VWFIRDNTYNNGDDDEKIIDVKRGGGCGMFLPNPDQRRRPAATQSTDK